MEALVEGLEGLMVLPEGQEESGGLSGGLQGFWRNEQGREDLPNIQEASRVSSGEPEG